MKDIALTEQRKDWYSALLGVGRFKNKSIEDAVNELGEIKIVEKMNTPVSQNCYWHVFKNKMWFKQLCHTEAKNALIYEGLTFLKKKGYKEVETPQENDIVAYSIKHYLKSGEQEVAHYGIFKNGKVISKFGRGNVYEHPIELIPECVGDTVTFLRKKEKK